MAWNAINASSNSWSVLVGDVGAGDVVVFAVGFPCVSWLYQPIGGGHYV